MEKEIKLKKKKSSKKESISIFFDKRKRYWMVLLCITPLIVVACIFGFVVYKEAKGLMSLAQGEDTTIKNENIVTTMDYRLRDNATEYQKEIFSQLKDVLESEEVDDQMAVELIAKNYIADFYTFTNKAGQYDIGGMYYWYSEEDAKINIYQAARDGFYKYVSNYITDYGAENLIEVEDIQITKCIKEDPIKISVHWAYEKGEDVIE